MLEYVVLTVFALVFVYFIYKYFQEKKEERTRYPWLSSRYVKQKEYPRDEPKQSGIWFGERKIPKPMKPFYFSSKEKKEVSPKKISLEIIAACSICGADLNAMSKMVCPKCFGVFCSKHVRKHKCKMKKFPKYGMDSKKYDDGTVVYYTDRRVPIK